MIHFIVPVISSSSSRSTGFEQSWQQLGASPLDAGLLAPSVNGIVPQQAVRCDFRMPEAVQPTRHDIGQSMKSPLSIFFNSSAEQFDRVRPTHSNDGGGRRGFIPLLRLCSHCRGGDACRAIPQGCQGPCCNACPPAAQAGTPPPPPPAAACRPPPFCTKAVHSCCTISPLVHCLSAFLDFQTPLSCLLPCAACCCPAACCCRR